MPGLLASARSLDSSVSEAPAMRTLDPRPEGEISDPRAAVVCVES